MKKPWYFLKHVSNEFFEKFMKESLAVLKNTLEEISGAITLKKYILGELFVILKYISKRILIIFFF